MTTEAQKEARRLFAKRAKTGFFQKLKSVPSKYRVTRDRARFEVERAKIQYENAKRQLSAVSSPSKKSAAFGPSPKSKPAPKKPKGRAKKQRDWMDDYF